MMSMALGMRLHELHDEPEKLLEQSWREKGGKATAKITEQQMDLVFKMYSDEKRGSVSHTAACIRTAAVFKKNRA